MFKLYCNMHGFIYFWNTDYTYRRPCHQARFMSDLWGENNNNVRRINIIGLNFVSYRRTGGRDIALK